MSSSLMSWPSVRSRGHGGVQVTGVPQHHGVEEQASRPAPTRARGRHGARRGPPPRTRDARPPRGPRTPAGPVRSPRAAAPGSCAATSPRGRTAPPAPRRASTPPVQKAAELPPPLPVGEVPVPETLLDLHRVFVRCPAPLRVPIHARGARDAELPGRVLHDLPRHREKITVAVVQEKEPLQLPGAWRLGERPVRLGLFFSQKFHRHDGAVASTDSHPTIFPRTPAAPREVCRPTMIDLGGTLCTATTRTRCPDGDSSPGRPWTRPRESWEALPSGRDPDLRSVYDNVVWAGGSARSWAGYVVTRVRGCRTACSQGVGGQVIPRQPRLGARRRLGAPRRC